MTRPERVVVVGASIAGMTAAETMRQEGYRGELVLIGDEGHEPYVRPPMSKQVLMGEWDPAQTEIRSAAEIRDLDIELRMDCPATGLDVGGRVLATSQGPVGFDELIIATGSAPRRHPGIQSALTLRTVTDALALREALVAASSVLVVGSGILGSEVASASRKHGVTTTMAGIEGRLGFGSVGVQLSDRLAELHREHDVELKLSSPVLASRALPGGTEIDFAEGTRSFDVVVAMIGASPTTGWLEGSSLRLANGICCDANGLAAPGVHAVGDVAAWYDPASGRHVRVEHQSNAIEQAIAVAARVVRGTECTRPVPLFWSEIHGTRINAYGWFDPGFPLSAATPGRSVLTSSDPEGEVHGVVGWNASPREFRAARASVVPIRSTSPEGASS